MKALLIGGPHSGRFVEVFDGLPEVRIARKMTIEQYRVGDGDRAITTCAPEDRYIRREIYFDEQRFTVYVYQFDTDRNVMTMIMESLEARANTGIDKLAGA